MIPSCKQCKKAVHNFQKQSRARQLIILAVVLFFGLEISCRLHHYFVYGLFHPILGHIIHYNPDGFNLLRKEAEKWQSEPKEEVNYSYNAILSGASTAFGFGVEKHKNLLSGLNKEYKKKFQFINNAFPAIRLSEELERLQNIELQQIELIVFFSGFNDCYLSAPHFTAQLRHARFFACLPILNRSLLLHKIIARSKILNLFAEDENFIKSITEIQKKIHTIKRKVPDTRILFVMQPHLSSKKQKTTAEKRVYEKYKKNMGSNFLKRRKELKNALLQIPYIELSDTQELFDNNNSELFIDPCHLNEKGTEMALQHIIQVIK